jgi:hypothetical protein
MILGMAAIPVWKNSRVDKINLLHDFANTRGGLRHPG